MTCLIPFRVYNVNDEVADKNFELELSWVGRGNNFFYSFVPVRRPKPMHCNCKKTSVQ